MAIRPPSSLPSLRLRRLGVAALALTLLASCGGGTGEPAQQASAQSVSVQTYITDNLTRDYSKVWVSIRKITAVDGAGAEVTLLDATAAPVAVNLSSLAAVGQLMSTVKVPAGIYRQLAVTLDNQVQLVSLDGATTTQAKFAATGTEFVLRVREVELDASTGTQFVLDFNLEKFIYNAATGLVVPSLDLPRAADAFRKFERQFAEARGTVLAVNATAQTVTVDDPRLGKGTVVKLAAGSAVVGPDGSKLTLADVKAGDRIEAKGVVTPGATTADPSTVTTLLLEVRPASASGSTPAVAALVKGEGKVTAVQGSLVTVAIEEASFLPGSGSVTVDIASAKFSHGQASDLVVGVKVEFSGTVSGTGAAAKVVAVRVQVAGAASKGELERSPLLKVSGVEGKVAAVGTDGTFTLTVSRSISAGAAASGTITVDAKTAIYARGSASCLAAGKEVEALGTLSGTVLTARIVAVKDCAGQKASGG